MPQEVIVTVPQGLFPLQGIEKHYKKGSMFPAFKKWSENQNVSLSGSELWHQSTESISWALLFNRVFFCTKNVNSS